LLSSGKLSLFFDAYFWWLNTHEKYMHRCIELAQLGAGSVAPNPMVGAVLVYNGNIIGEGWHRHYGGPHAEVNCINSVAENNQSFIQRSTLYVSLEPCAHYGKTPPCSKLIIENNIPEVVIGCRDVYKEVDGKGIQQLQEAGINTTTGILEKEAKHLNRRFFTFQQQHRPFIILKWAQTGNEKISKADFSRLLISNEYTNRLVHQWRSEEAAIMVGTNTALHDNPYLTTRLWKGKNPLRIVIDNDLKLPSSLHLFDGSVETLVFNQKKQETGGTVKYYKLDKNDDSIREMLNILFELKIQSVLVEGGAALLQSFIDSSCWDEARIITSKEMIKDAGIAAPILKNSTEQQEAFIQNDRICFYTNKLQQHG
jgi:diaminohydroxyphosphoribosylaminopyrimidine deaminase / 5-amino-6-(5-phosphoribosylamino)uracil reductase